MRISSANFGRPFCWPGVGLFKTKNNVFICQNFYLSTYCCFKECPESFGTLHEVWREWIFAFLSESQSWLHSRVQVSFPKPVCCYYCCVFCSILHACFLNRVTYCLLSLIFVPIAAYHVLHVQREIWAKNLVIIYTVCLVSHNSMLSETDRSKFGET